MPAIGILPAVVEGRPASLDVMLAVPGARTKRTSVGPPLECYDRARSVAKPAGDRIEVVVALPARQGDQDGGQPVTGLGEVLATEGELSVGPVTGRESNVGLDHMELCGIEARQRVAVVLELG